MARRVMADRHGHHWRRTARKAARLASEVRDREELARRYGSAVAALVEMDQTVTAWRAEVERLKGDIRGG